MIIAVVGARGNLGRLLVQQGVARGLIMRAISPHMEQGEYGAGVACHRASNVEQLTVALHGADAVALVFPASIVHPDTYGEELRQVFSAARMAGVRRAVGLLGSAGALTAHGERLVDTDYFQETTRHFYQHVHAAWDVYRNERELDWVAVIPAARMQLHLRDRGHYRTRTDEHLVTTDDVSRHYFDVSQISYGDCARAMLDELQQQRHSRQFLTVGY